MSFDVEDLFDSGDEASAADLQALRPVHELLLGASEPPCLPRRLERPPKIEPLGGKPRGAWLTTTRSRRARLRVLAALATAGALTGAFAVGYAVAPGRTVAAQEWRSMHGVGVFARATAEIEVGQRDASGTYPLAMSVTGLPRLPSASWYTLYLTKPGRPRETCGTFRTGPGPVTDVRLNAPRDLWKYTGWVVTARVRGASTGVLLTT